MNNKGGNFITENWLYIALAIVVFLVLLYAIVKGFQKLSLGA
jgi:hypothetical protein